MGARFPWLSAQPAEVAPQPATGATANDDQSNQGWFNPSTHLANKRVWPPIQKLVEACSATGAGGSPTTPTASAAAPSYYDENYAHVGPDGGGGRTAAEDAWLDEAQAAVAELKPLVPDAIKSSVGLLQVGLRQRVATRQQVMCLLFEPPTCILCDRRYPLVPAMFGSGVVPQAKPGNGRLCKTHPQSERTEFAGSFEAYFQGQFRYIIGPSVTAAVLGTHLDDSPDHLQNHTGTKQQLGHHAASHPNHTVNGEAPSATAQCPRLVVDVDSPLGDPVTTPSIVEAVGHKEDGRRKLPPPAQPLTLNERAAAFDDAGAASVTVDGSTLVIHLADPGPTGGDGRGPHRFPPPTGHHRPLHLRGTGEVLAPSGHTGQDSDMAGTKPKTDQGLWSTVNNYALVRQSLTRQEIACIESLFGRAKKWTLPEVVSYYIIIRASETSRPGKKPRQNAFVEIERELGGSKTMDEIRNYHYNLLSRYKVPICEYAQSFDGEPVGNRRAGARAVDRGTADTRQAPEQRSVPRGAAGVTAQRKNQLSKSEFACLHYLCQKAARWSIAELIPYYTTIRQNKGQASIGPEVWAAIEKQLGGSKTAVQIQTYHQNWKALFHYPIVKFAQSFPVIDSDPEVRAFAQQGQAQTPAGKGPRRGPTPTKSPKRQRKRRRHGGTPEVSTLSNTWQVAERHHEVCEDRAGNASSPTASEEEDGGESEDEDDEIDE